MSETTISFVRHGEVFNPREVFYGRLPRFGLSAVGREQADTAGDYLQQTLPPVESIYTSPLLRTRQTAAILEDKLGRPTPIKKTKKLIEIHSPHDGLPLERLVSRNWDLYDGIESHYEQPEDIVRRTQQWVARIRRDYAGKHVVGVTHGDIVMYQILWALNHPLTLEAKLDVAQTRLGSDYLHTASVSTFTFQTADVAERPAFQYFGR